MTLPAQVLGETPARASASRLWPLLLAALLAACAGASAPAGGISDIEAILSGEVEVVDIGPTSATILAETDIPVVCAVSYGTTTAYGGIATDTDMAGGGHQNHHPLLTGLEPDTEYHFQLAGVGPDGRLYRSQDFTFRTALAEEGTTRPPGENVTGQATVSQVSSNWNGGDNDSAFGANKAIDGDLSTEWSSDGDGDDAFITLDLGREMNVTGVGFATRTMGSSAQISTFTVTTDGGQTFGPFELSGPTHVFYFELEARARTLRFDVESSSGGNTGVVEIEVYAQP